MNYYAITSIYQQALRPFGVLSQHDLRVVDFEPITIFYGGNGCGKTTALNVIAEKTGLERGTFYNRSNFYEDYLDLCEFESIGRVPKDSRIITSVLLSMQGAKIYDFDEDPVDVKKWTELENVRTYYDFFMEHEKEFK